jgi:hypothetical protein
LLFDYHRFRNAEEAEKQNPFNGGSYFDLNLCYFLDYLSIGNDKCSFSCWSGLSSTPSQRR